MGMFAPARRIEPPHRLPRPGDRIIGENVRLYLLSEV